VGWKMTGVNAFYGRKRPCSMTAPDSDRNSEEVEWIITVLLCTVVSHISHDKVRAQRFYVESWAASGGGRHCRNYGTQNVNFCSLAGCTYVRQARVDRKTATRGQ
jgi:hypothetical protein